jgi:ABC-2 type transport system permease protein
MVLGAFFILSGTPPFTAWGGFATMAIAFLGIFFGSDAISGEFQNKTGYFSVPNPIRRSTIYLGKWMAAYIASSIVLGIYASLTIAASMYEAHAPTWGFGLSILFSYLYLAAVISLTFFISSIFKSTIHSFATSAAVLLVLFLMFDSTAGMIHQEPWFILSYAGGIIGDVMSTPFPPQVSMQELAQGRVMAIYHATVPEGLLVIGAYFAGALVLGLLLFRRKEFT